MDFVSSHVVLSHNPIVSTALNQKIVTGMSSCFLPRLYLDNRSAAPSQLTLQAETHPRCVAAPCSFLTRYNTNVHNGTSQVSALIVENTFTSIPDIVKGIPVLRHISCLCTQRWNSASKVARLPASLPILMLSGLIDQVVPPSHMQKLWKVAESRCSKGKADETDLPVKSADDAKVESLDKMVTFPRGTHSRSFPLLVGTHILTARYA